MIAALFVQKNGVYYGLPDIDPWDEERDARLYAGPWPVVAHPPCERWGRYWSGGPMLARTERAKKKGDDNGCFAAALASIRAHGGVLEHPEGSHAWVAYGLPRPPRKGGWIPGAGHGEWSCCVEQGNYGHAARKATWLYYVGRHKPPCLTWGKSAATAKLDDGYHGAEERKRATKTVERLSKRQRAATPEAFRDVMLSLARRSAE